MPKPVPAKLDSRPQPAQKPWWRERSVHIAVALWITGFIVVIGMAQPACLGKAVLVGPASCPNESGAVEVRE